MSKSGTQYLLRGAVKRHDMTISSVPLEVDVEILVLNEPLNLVVRVAVYPRARPHADHVEFVVDFEESEQRC